MTTTTTTTTYATLGEKFAAERAAAARRIAELTRSRDGFRAMAAEHAADADLLARSAAESRVMAADALAGSDPDRYAARMFQADALESARMAHDSRRAAAELAEHAAELAAELAAARSAELAIIMADRDGYAAELAELAESALTYAVDCEYRSDDARRAGIHAEDFADAYAAEHAAELARSAERMSAELVDMASASAELADTIAARSAAAIRLGDSGRSAMAVAGAADRAAASIQRHAADGASSAAAARRSADNAAAAIRDAGRSAELADALAEFGRLLSGAALPIVD